MNRLHSFGFILCGLMIGMPVTAAWYSPLVRLGQSLCSQAVEHKKITACGAGVLLGTLGCIGFDMLRDREINRRLQEKINRLKEVLQNTHCSADKKINEEFDIDVSAWGKKCTFRIKVYANPATGAAIISVYRGSHIIQMYHL